jgi:hypothetical protein
MVHVMIAVGPLGAKKMYVARYHFNRGQSASNGRAGNRVRVGGYCGFGMRCCVSEHTSLARKRSGEILEAPIPKKARARYS